MHIHIGIDTYIHVDMCVYPHLGLPGGASGKESSCQCRRHRDAGSGPWVGKILRRRGCQPTPVFLLENTMDKGAWWAIVHRVIRSQA